MKLTKKENQQILSQYKKWEEAGNKMTTYFCNHCKKQISTKQPNKKMTGSEGYWDSVTICLECGKLNFVIVYPNGKTKSKEINL